MFAGPRKLGAEDGGIFREPGPGNPGGHLHRQSLGMARYVPCNSTHGNPDRSDHCLLHEARIQLPRS